MSKASPMQAMIFCAWFYLHCGNDQLLANGIRVCHIVLRFFFGGAFGGVWNFHRISLQQKTLSPTQQQKRIVIIKNNEVTNKYAHFSHIKIKHRVWSICAHVCLCLQSVGKWKWSVGQRSVVLNWIVMSVKFHICKSYLAMYRISYDDGICMLVIEQSKAKWRRLKLQSRCMKTIMKSTYIFS